LNREEVIKELADWIEKKLEEGPTEEDLKRWADYFASRPRS